MANLDKSKNHSIFGRPFFRLGLVRVSQALHSTLRKRCSSFRRFTAGVLATLALATADTAFAFDALSKPQLPPKPSATKSGSGTAAPAPSAQRSQPSASSDKTVTVTGIVRDEAGKPMSGVGVIVKGMLTGTVTGTDGSYALKARPNDELSFSFLGYKTQEVFVGSKSTIDITLVDEAQAIDGVVVTALGLKRDEKSLGYAASKVDGDVLASSATSTNWLSGLTGQVPD